MLHTISLAALIASPPVEAATVNCFSTAAAAHAVAVERDSGTPFSEAPGQVAITMRALDHREMDAAALQDMVEVVYAAPDVSKDQVYSRVLQACQDLSGQM